MHIHILDIVIVLLLIWGAYSGFKSGFLIQSLTLVAFLLGIWAGFHFCRVVSEFMVEHFHMHGLYVTPVAFAIILILVIILINIIGYWLTNLMGKGVIGTMNRIGGAIFGILKMAFIISILFWIILSIDVHHKFFTQEIRHKSFLEPPIERIAPAVFPFFHLTELKDRLLKV